MKDYPPWMLAKIVDALWRHPMGLTTQALLGKMSYRSVNGVMSNAFQDLVASGILIRKKGYGHGGDILILDREKVGEWNTIPDLQEKLAKLLPQLPTPKK